MCGIVGYIGGQLCKDYLLTGLRRLEYRGYDSSGVAIHTGDGFRVVRSVGKVSELEQRLVQDTFDGYCGLAHTRWATHGAPTEANAHPHVAGRVVLVHNGIIENYAELRAELQQQGREFLSDTDTEVFAHLIDSHFYGDRTLRDALYEAQKEVRGSYAVVVSNVGDAMQLVAARSGSPLVIGQTDDGVFVASDVPAFLDQTRRCLWLDEGEIAVVSANGSIRVFTDDGDERALSFETVDWDLTAAKKNGHPHFMIKEIFEQPQVLRNTIMPRIKNGALNVTELAPLADWITDDLQRIVFVACGSSYYASLLGKTVIEQWTGIPVEVCLGSEFRYWHAPLNEKSLVIAVSQSGETADTLVSLQAAKEEGARTIAVCNVVGSTIARTAEAVLFTNAGPEISVASTKAFVCQYATILLTALSLAKEKRTLDEEEIADRLSHIEQIPHDINTVLSSADQLKEMSQVLMNAKLALFVGRQLGFPIALEGALKLKEIAYIPAQGYAAGELKHGPIALIEQDTPVVAIATRGANYEKTLSNICEIKARGSQMIAIANPGCDELERLAEHVLIVPEVAAFIEPLLCTVAVQLLAYYVSAGMGYDVDRPRNLAKSVTVE